MERPEIPLLAHRQGTNTRWKACLLCAALGVAVLLAPAITSGQTPPPTEAETKQATPPTTTGAPADPPSGRPAGEGTAVPASEAAPSAAQNEDTEGEAGPTAAIEKRYGLWTLIPALVAIFLAVVARQVVPALFTGVLVGAYMMVPCLTADHRFAGEGALLSGIRLAAEQYIFDAAIDPDHMKIMFFTLLIGFMVGVIGKNGGTQGLVSLVVGDSTSSRRGALTAWAAGIIVFFDDYANTMVVGPTMRAVFDRVKLSREKLAYIVDSTAAPVASIALIGTWVGTEISYIQDGLNQVADAGTPQFLLGETGNPVTAMGLFVSSIGYRFYPILALFFVLLVALTGRDFGPMRKAEQRASDDTDERPIHRRRADDEDDIEPVWWLGLLPILALVGVTLAILYQTGYAAAGGDIFAGVDMPMWEKIYEIVKGGDSFNSIFYGALAAAVLSVLLTTISRAIPTREAVDAGLDGMARMFPAIVVLILAWAIGGVLGKDDGLCVGPIVADALVQAKFQAELLPLAVFAAAALISFSTGTSWTTMAILCPLAVTSCVGLVEGMDPATASKLLSASVGSVLAGAIFGDHCSPISDTTVLSSIAAGCRHEDHVWTQIPYALVVAVVSMGVGDFMVNRFDQPWWIGLAAGAVVLFLIIYAVGRPVEHAPNVKRIQLD